MAVLHVSSYFDYATNYIYVPAHLQASPVSQMAEILRGKKREREGEREREKEREGEKRGGRKGRGTEREVRGRGKGLRYF